MDRDKVMKGLQTCSNPNAPCDGCPYFAELNCTEILCRDALALLKEQEPVKHGRWIKDESTYAGPGLDNLQCSECKRNAVTWRRDIPLSRMYRYCPNCGAKMDLEVADDIQGL